jgi:hypothetical protein
MPTIRELLNVIDGDPWRSANLFSPDIVTACNVLLNPYSRGDERDVAIRGWLTKNQPCVFGKTAAKSDRIFISIIDDELLKQGDEVVKEQLLLDKQTWKQWSLGANGKHSFLAVILSPRMHYAAPNRALQVFSEHIRQLFVGDTVRDPAGNDVSTEWIYLKNPTTGGIKKFRVILDYFASAGDQRWWHDHRFPGGIAFSLNSLGHMVRTKEWYENLAEPHAWATRMAMATIAGAQDVPTLGTATKLIDLKDNQPRRKSECPFADPQKLPADLRGKDWTGYNGWLHTDHSVRAEFFDQHNAPDRKKGEYILDFTYIAGSRAGEDNELMNGVDVSLDELYSEIGQPEDWRFDSSSVPRDFSPRPADQELKINEALAVCRSWLTED